MPHKHNAGSGTIYLIAIHRHQLVGCENGLKQRGGLTLWITPEAIAEWKAAAFVCLRRVSPLF